MALWWRQAQTVIQMILRSLVQKMKSCSTERGQESPGRRNQSQLSVKMSVSASDTEAYNEMEAAVYDSPPSPIFKRKNNKRKKLQKPISIPDLPKSAYELSQEERMKELKAKANQRFNSDAVFPTDNSLKPDSYLQNLAVMYESD